MVEPDRETGAMRPVIEWGQPVYVTSAGKSETGLTGDQRARDELTSRRRDSDRPGQVDEMSAGETAIGLYSPKKTFNHGRDGTTRKKMQHGKSGLGKRFDLVEG